MALGNTFKVYL